MIKEKGYTLVEMIVVLGIIMLVVPSVFAIVFAITRQQVKVYRLTIVKNQGDAVLTTIENTIRSNAVGLYGSAADVTAGDKTKQICRSDYPINPQPPPDDNGSGFYFKDKKGQWFNFTGTDRVSFTSTQGAYPTGDLTNKDKVVISAFHVSCVQGSQYVAPLVKVSFTISYKTNSVRTEETTVPLNYQTQIRLRNSE